MITEAAVFLRDEVGRYLVQEGAIPLRADVMLGNVATLEDNQTLSNKVVLTLVNIEEESTLKNGSYFISNASSNGIETISPPVYLNLYILFSATLPQNADDGDYQRALQRIASVIELFQAKKEFTVQNSPGFVPANLDKRLLTELRLHPELYTLTFEQINHLWGSLGGKQSPFVMYKMRLVKIQSVITMEAPLIETVESDSELLGLASSTNRLKTPGVYVEEEKTELHE
jgi:hypothetical protein